MRAIWRISILSRGDKGHSSAKGDLQGNQKPSDGILDTRDALVLSSGDPVDFRPGTLAKTPAGGQICMLVSGKGHEPSELPKVEAPGHSFAIGEQANPDDRYTHGSLSVQVQARNGSGITGYAHGSNSLFIDTPC